MNDAHRRALRRSGPRSLGALTLALVVSAATLAGVTAATEQVATAASPSLSVSPHNYVGGQRLRWTGNVGHRGERRLVLQFNMGTATGGSWSTVDGFAARTRADGSFSFVFPAPSMFNIRYRVKAGEYVTPGRRFEAKTQDLTIRGSGQQPNDHSEPLQVGVGESFGIAVDTTPENIYRSPDSKELPVFEGRELTLQKRVSGSSWDTVRTGTVGANGTHTFSGLTEDAGTTVYRVRQENVTSDKNQIGWTQSFPLYVLVGQEAQDSYAGRYGTNQSSSSNAPRSGSLGRQPPTASQRYSWFPSRFDFAWEYGQSLSSRPARGTRIQGSWEDYSSGSGRVQKYNGGLGIDSKRYAGAGGGDFGTTRATLRGNAITRGRWETSLRIRSSFERGERPYQVLAELIPSRAADYDCGAHNITVARISPYSRRVRVGVRSPHYQWTGTKTLDYTPMQNAYNAAIEISGKHITWFLNSAPVASVTSSSALPGVPMTLRLSLQGHGADEMNQTNLISDWQRGFPIDTGRQTVSQRKLDRTSAPATSCTS
jgi:hypothetical protein